MRSNIRVPLPKGWPRTIRSGIVHVISIAQFSLTHTRSWAANNWNHIDPVFDAAPSAPRRPVGRRFRHCGHLRRRLTR